VKIKRFVDKDMRQVLRRVRDEQGPDAVILSNRRVEGGIEVIAAIDYDAALMQHALGTEQVATGAVPTAASPDGEEIAPAGTRVADADVVTAEPRPQAVPGDELALSAMHAEITSLRGLMETQLSGLLWKDGARRSPLRAQILRNLSRLGIAPDIAIAVVNRLGAVDDLKHIWQQPLAALAQMIPVCADALLANGGRAALIGPTGVGKTTTIAKIAARYAMHHGTDDIALVCADAYRIGAREHLTAFGNILGVKVHAASDPDELGRILDGLQAKKLVLIDTEGISQRDADLTRRLAAYGAATGGAAEQTVKFYLTLSASSQQAVLDETVRCFGKMPLAGAVVTKVDEAGQLGCVLSTAIRHELPLAWIADGQRIPDDLHAAERKKLWLINRAIECMEASQPRIDERRMAEDFGIARTAHA
jgi:flagellar biosynthesis protein FlhF